MERAKYKEQEEDFRYKDKDAKQKMERKSRIDRDEKCKMETGRLKENDSEIKPEREGREKRFQCD